jgi:hypothetical protein
VTRDVSAHLDVTVVDPSNLEFQIAVAELPGTTVTESLSFRLDGEEITPTVIRAETGGRIHRFDCGRGQLVVDYRARVEGEADPAPVVERDLSVYLRPSRYSESDKFLGFAATEFGRYTSDADSITYPAAATPSTAPPTRSSRAAESAATTRISSSHCCAP